jgi:hypothetical protein
MGPMSEMLALSCGMSVLENRESADR